MLNYLYQMDLVAASVAAVAVADYFGISVAVVVADIDFLHVLNSY